MGDGAWHDPLFCPDCPCYFMSANHEALGMFEDDSLPSGCCRSYGCCGRLYCPVMMPFVGGLFCMCSTPFIYCLQTRAEEKMGITPSGCCTKVVKASAPALIAGQISRGLVLRGMQPRAKKEDELESGSAVIGQQ